MDKHELIKKEIIGFVSSRTKDEELIFNVEKELEIMSDTIGLESANNLEIFHDVWHKSLKAQNLGIEINGNKNDINSWTAYALGLTNSKPDGEFLYTRRAFARAGFPDIDVDFDDINRHLIYDYVIQKYGRDHTANVGTWGALKARSAITRIGKALDIAEAFHKGKDEYVSQNAAKIKEITESLPKERNAKMVVQDASGRDVEVKNVKMAYDLCPDFRFYMDRYPEIMEHTQNIEGLLSIPGAHAGGLVISDIPISKIAPLRKGKGEVEYATHYDKNDLESIGLIKFDLLAIKTLSVIAMTLKMIKDNYGIDVDIENLPLDDKKTLELYRSGKLDGVFQCESSGMQAVMKEIGVDMFDDVVAAIALFRPGPIGSIPEYCKRKAGIKDVDYFHDSIKPHVQSVLSRTYGILVYQEQLMQVCNLLAKFTITDGYVMIKAVGKKMTELLLKFENQFIKGCIENGVPESVAKDYWNSFIVPFADYGFNLAHSGAYGFMSYQTAFLKANYPEEFFCAYLNVENHKKSQNREEKIAKLIKDMKRFDIDIDEIGLNTCRVDYEIVKKKDVASGVYRALVSPSIMCKGIGAKSAEALVACQPYKNLRDLAVKTMDNYSKEVNQNTISALVDEGFFKDYITKYNQANKKKKLKLTKEIILKNFVKFREDERKRRKKGIGDDDVFDMLGDDNES